MKDVYLILEINDNRQWVIDKIDWRLWRSRARQADDVHVIKGKETIYHMCFWNEHASYIRAKEIAIDYHLGRNMRHINLRD